MIENESKNTFHLSSNDKLKGSAEAQDGKEHSNLSSDSVVSDKDNTKHPQKTNTSTTTMKDSFEQVKTNDKPSIQDNDEKKILKSSMNLKFTSALTQTSSNDGKCTDNLSNDGSQGIKVAKPSTVVEKTLESKIADENVTKGIAEVVISKPSNSNVVVVECDSNSSVSKETNDGNSKNYLVCNHETATDNKNLSNCGEKMTRRLKRRRMRRRILLKFPFPISLDNSLDTLKEYILNNKFPTYENNFLDKFDNIRNGYPAVNFVQSTVKRLNNGKWLNDNLIDFWMSWLVSLFKL